MTYTRKCANWLETFGRWSLPRCESPETFVFWSGLFTLASALRRQVKVGKNYLGGWECPPHLYIIFIGEAGKVRKTTAAKFGADMLEEIGFIKQGPQILSQAYLMTSIAESPDSSIYLLSEEFSDLMMKSGDDMYAFLTSLFDGKKTLETGTHIRGKEFAMKPCVNLLAATTPQWIAEKMPEQVIGGGFASRVVFIQEERVRQRRMYYREVLKTMDFGAMYQDLLDDLRHIAEKIAGDFEIEPSAEIWMENWYQNNAEGDISSYKLSGYFQRRPAIIHKVAMLLRIAKSDELVLYKEDFQSAIDIVLKVEKNLPKVFEGIGKNPFIFDTIRIKDFIVATEPVAHSEVMAAFKTAAEPWKLEALVKSLVIMDEVKFWKNGNGEVYYASKGYVDPATITGARKPFDPEDIETWNN